MSTSLPRGRARQGPRAKTLKQAVSPSIAPTLRCQARHQDAVARPRGRWIGWDNGAPLLAPERAPLRRAAGGEQGPKRRQNSARSRCRLERSYDIPPPALEARRPARLPGDPATQHPPSEVPYRCLKDTVGRSFPTGTNLGRPCARVARSIAPGQQPSRAREVSRRRELQRHRRPEHSDRAPPSTELDSRAAAGHHYYLGDRPRPSAGAR